MRAKGRHDDRIHTRANIPHACILLEQIVELSAELEESKNTLRQPSETEPAELSEQKDSDLPCIEHADSPLHQASTSLTRDISLTEKNMKSTMVKSIQSITDHLSKKHSRSSFYPVDDTANALQVGSKKTASLAEKIQRVVPGTDHKSKIVPNVCSICKEPPYGLMKTCSICLRIFHSMVSYSCVLNILHVVGWISMYVFG